MLSKGVDQPVNPSLPPLSLSSSSLYLFPVPKFGADTVSSECSLSLWQLLFFFPAFDICSFEWGLCWRLRLHLLNVCADLFL
jgi:hypothetical protein